MNESLKITGTTIFNNVKNGIIYYVPLITVVLYSKRGKI
jgi:hypothetical protein